MQNIWKFEFEVTDDPIVRAPRGAKFIRHVHAVNHTVLWVWAKVDDEQPMTEHRLHVRGTGHPHFEEVGRHLGTVVVGPLVWHVFEERA